MQQVRPKTWVLLVFVLLVGLVWQKRQPWVSEDQPNGFEASLTATQSTTAPVVQPVLKAAQPAYQPTITAASAIILDAQTGAVLFEKNADEKRSPASVTKLMTAWVVRHIYPLAKIVTVQEEAFSAGTVMELRVGEQLTVANLLYGLLMTSGNDAAFAFANQHLLGYSGFVAAMNQQAQALNLTGTSFTNPSGLDQPGHLSTARDIATLTKVVMSDELLRTVMSTKRIVVSDATGTVQHPLQTTHQLLGTHHVVAGKTGTTDLAGEVLTTVATIDYHEVIVVVMGSSDRYQDTLKLLDWAGSEYTWIVPS